MNEIKKCQKQKQPNKKEATKHKKEAKKGLAKNGAIVPNPAQFSRS